TDSLGDKSIQNTAPDQTVRAVESSGLQCPPLRTVFPEIVRALPRRFPRGHQSRRRSSRIPPASAKKNRRHNLHPPRWKGREWASTFSQFAEWFPCALR